MALAEPASLRLGVLDELVGYAVRRAQLRIYADYFRSVGDPAFTPARFTALVLIGENPGLDQTALGEAMGMARSGIKLLVDWLQERKLVERRARPGDRRRNGLWLTAAGSEVRRRLEAQVRRHEQGLLRRLAPAEVAALKAMLARIR
jgi:DNA-binding MarR family transcriptional regulator